MPSSVRCAYSCAFRLTLHKGATACLRPAVAPALVLHLTPTRRNVSFLDLPTTTVAYSRERIITSCR